MTEKEWLITPHLGSLLHAASQRSSERKVRLFSCACARNLFSTDAHPGLHRGVETAEQIADGTASRETIESVFDSFGSLVHVGDYEAHGFTGEHMFRASLVKESLKPRAVLGARRILARLSDYEADIGLEISSRGLPELRDIFGNPFRPVIFSPEWRTDTAVSLARGMYESRDFSAMPILADALQDAGCDSADVLGHCRGPGPHVRGCWAVDLVLGRS